MAGGALQDLAEAVKDTLNTASMDNAFILSFTAVRSYKPEHSLEDLASLKVDIVGRKWRSERISRGGRQAVDYAVDVCVQKKMTDPDDTSEVDPYALLTEQIGDYFLTHAVLGRTEQLITPDSDENGDFSFGSVAIREHHVFKGFVTLNFRGHR